MAGQSWRTVWYTSDVQFQGEFLVPRLDLLLRDTLMESDEEQIDLTNFHNTATHLLDIQNFVWVVDFRVQCCRRNPCDQESKEGPANSNKDGSVQGG